MPSWLPNTIDYNKYKNIQEFIDEIYNIFITDFHIKKIKFNDKYIGLAQKLLSCTPNENCYSAEYNCSNCPFQGKLDIFNHVITGKINTYRTPGKFNLKRAVRIHWIKYIIDNYKNGVCYFNEQTRKGLNHYFWLVNEKFIVIFIETKTHKYFLKTAFYIDKPTYEHKFQKKYETYLLKKSTIKIAD